MTGNHRRAPVAASPRPNGPVRLIVGSSPGGANDVVGRTLAAVAAAAGGPLLEVVNVPGEGQSRAWKALRECAPDGRTIATASNVLLTNHLTGRSDLHYSSFTPIAMLVEEPLCIAVAARSAARSWEAILQTGSGLIRAGFIGDAGNARHLALATAFAGRSGGPKQAAACNGYETEDEAVHALSAGQLDVYSDAANAIAALAAAGKLRPVAVSARRRLGSVYAETPCLPEFGVEEPFTAWRAIIGPPGMHRETIQYWESTIERWSASEAWESWLAKQYWTNHYLGSSALSRFLADTEARLRGRLLSLEH